MCQSLKTFDREISCVACNTIKDIITINEYPYSNNRKAILTRLIELIAMHVQSLLTELRSHTINSDRSSSCISDDGADNSSGSGGSSSLSIDMDSDIGMVLLELSYTIESIASTEVYYITTGLTEGECQQQSFSVINNGKDGTRDVVTEHHIAHFFQSWLDLIACRPRKLLISTFNYWISLEDVSISSWYSFMKQHVLIRLLGIIIAHCKYPEESIHWSIATGR